jgi:hypothetical protein
MSGRCECAVGEPNNKAMLIKETQSRYRLQATGRQNCVGLLAYLEAHTIHNPYTREREREATESDCVCVQTVKRQDLVMRLLGMFDIVRNYDRLVPPAPAPALLSPLVFLQLRTFACV